MINKKYLYQRAEFIESIRSFCKKKNILEVETPILNSYCLTHPETIPFTTRFNKEVKYLHTSPESGMKRLLGEINESIYQICKAFRNDPCDATHNPEFLIMEWYEPNITYHQLMSKIDEFLWEKYNIKSIKISFKEAIQTYTSIDPFSISPIDLKTIASKKYNYKRDISSDYEMNLFFDFLLSTFIIPELSKKQPLYVYNYPYYSSCLAKINEDNGNKIAERFELFFKGIELGNGYQELTSSEEFKKRILNENNVRNSIGEKPLDLDLFLFEALKKGMPISSGVALGLDRMIMIYLGENDIKSILPITFDDC